MARTESKMIMGYLPIEPQHHPAILSLVAPATPTTKILDPFAGEGEFLEAAAEAWNVTPYANELDDERAAKCIERFGPKQAVRCDAERLIASNNAFQLLWCNPPYDHDGAGTPGNKRIELRYLRHSWKWAADGGLVLWVVYQQHLTESAAEFFARNASCVDVWALPGKHLNEYQQIIVAAVKGVSPNPEELYDQIMAQKAQPRLLKVQPEAVYKLPAPRPINRFVFAPDTIDEQQGLRLIEEQGAWKTQGFQALLHIPQPPPQIEPVVAPRPGHMALVLAAGVANGAVIETEDYGQVAIRGKTQHVEQIARVEVEADPTDPERQVKKTTVRLKPTTTLTLLAGDGTVVEMDGDEALLGFITANKKALADYLNHKFKPMYRFDMNGIGGWLERIRLKGKYPMYAAQKHVVAAVTRGFQDRDSILLVGSMGTGKTLMGGSTAIAIASGVVKTLQGQMRPDQICLIVAPPHLIEKWKRELYSINPNIIAERLDRHEEVKAFLHRAETIGGNIPKIGLIKRDMTKLGCAWESAVVWRNEPMSLWRHGQPTPEGYEPHQRIVKQRVPQCPHCGCTVMQEKKGTTAPASESWLKSGKRQCVVCLSPLWREARDRGSQPKPGEKYPTKNPRYRLDEYFKRVYPDRLFLLIWDEAHEAAHGDTGNGESFGRFAGLAHKVLAMTGTPFNGKASSLFNLQYHLNPRVRQRYNWGGAPRLNRKVGGEQGYQAVIEDTGKQRGRAESQWVSAMGVREQVIEERPSYDSETGAFTGTSTYQRPYEEAPGISPLLVAEMLDHTIYFSLGDLGKWLPQYEEIALPVEMDSDTYEQYDRTRQQLKDYLIQRKWEGDVSFRGAYLQWAMGWVNSPFRPCEVIHNLKHPITGEKQPYTVAQLPSYGEDRVYAKEQALIDLVREELAQNRPCVVYVRQTDTRDIQPRIEALIRQHVPAAKPFILKNTIQAERREAVIEKEIVAGTNVLITNPILVQTGLDLIHFPTLVFYEITFNLSTMMQAAARSYRLNQTHEHCKVVYLFYEATMEHTAVQLMSRKQRAAKLLTGDVGLTGLDALTEGESGFEEALLDALAHEEQLLNPAELFKTDRAAGELDTEDAGYWNVEVAAERIPEETGMFEPHPLIESALQLGATIITEERLRTPFILPKPEKTYGGAHRVEHGWTEAVAAYLETVHLVADEARFVKLQAQLFEVLTHGVNKDDSTSRIIGVCREDWLPEHQPPLTNWISAWLKRERIVFAGCEDEVAAQLVQRALTALEQTAIKPIKPLLVKRPRRDLLRLPDDVGEVAPTPASFRPRQSQTESSAVQLALF
jgi:superfamily II DNA or RNA helicase